MTLLQLERLAAGYGGGTVLHGVDLTVPAGEVHAVIGHNGAGKTTMVHSACGLLRPDAGRVLIDGRDLTGRPPHLFARAGVGLVPQGRRVFAGLTVAEHLRLSRPTRSGARFGFAGVGAGARSGVGGTSGGDWTADRILDLMPTLRACLDRRGGLLSGGEQQMLAIARALLTRPRLLLLDEPTEGLAPAVTDQVAALLRELADQGLAILLAAPQLPLVLRVADRVSVLTAGRLTAHLDGDAVRADPKTLTEALTPK